MTGASMLTNNGRVPTPSPETMDETQRKIYDASVRFLGAPVGPRMALLVTPDVAQRWADLLAELGTSAIPRRLWELTILIVARHWGAQFEWWAHEEKGLAEGLPRAAIDALKAGDTPRFERDDEAAVYAYFSELYGNKAVADETYERLRTILGTRALVELTVLAGHYNSVAMTLIAHQVALPPGVEPPLHQL